MDIPSPEVLIEKKRLRYYRDDPVRWVWIFYGLVQATITMLFAFDVVNTTTPAEITTAVALIFYVGVNEVFVRPYRTGSRASRKQTIDDIEPDEVDRGSEGNPP